MMFETLDERFKRAQPRYPKWLRIATLGISIGNGVLAVIRLLRH